MVEMQGQKGFVWRSRVIDWMKVINIFYYIDTISILFSSMTKKTKI